jgi:hypothetical protein
MIERALKNGHWLLVILPEPYQLLLQPQLLALDWKSIQYPHHEGV